jgi:hypothetical protein
MTKLTKGKTRIVLSNILGERELTHSGVLSTHMVSANDKEYAACRVHATGAFMVVCQCAITVQDGPTARPKMAI